MTFFSFFFIYFIVDFNKTKVQVPQNMKNSLIIGGNGKVGTALQEQLLILGWNVSVLGSQDYNNPRIVSEKIEKSDVVCLTIPTLEGGEVAYKYFTQSLRIGKPVVTAEKAALANFFPRLKPYLPKIGILAILGGGSGMLRLVTQPNLGISSLYGIINGTLNYISTQASRGKNFPEIIFEAVRKGLCESGSNSLSDIVFKEFRDIRYKATNLFNLTCDPEEHLGINDLSYTLSSIHVIKELLSSPRHRYIVSIEQNPRDKMSAEDLLFARRGNWIVKGGFRDISIPEFKQLFSVSDENNSLVVHYKNQDNKKLVSQCYGIGAGPIPTASIMVEDILKLTS